MANPNAINIIQARGRVVRDPTNLSGSFPYGGTALGLFGRIFFRPGVRTREIIAEEWGGGVAKGVHAGERGVAAGVIRDFDADACAAIWPNASATTGVIKSSVDQANGPGHALDERSMVVLVAADEPTYPSLLLKNAMPVVNADLAARYSLNSGLGLGVSWVALPDANGDVWEWGKLEELTL